MSYCLIHENKIIQITEQQFDIAPPLEWVETEEEVSIGYGYVNQTFVPPPPAPDHSWDYIRTKRNSLLRGTDWTQLADSPLSPEKVNEFKTYRNTLRNIPQVFTATADITWPDIPKL